MRVALTCLAVGAALLTACSKKPEQTAPGAASAPPPTAAPADGTAPAVALATPGPITLAELPAPKAGLWQRVSQSDSDPAQTDTKCQDGKPLDPTKDGPPCQKINAMRTATGGFTIDGVCGAGKGVSGKMHLAGEGDFSRAYTTDTNIVLTGGPGGDMTLKNHSVWTYVGACPAK